MVAKRRISSWELIVAIEGDADAIAGAAESAADGLRSPTFHANKCNRGAWAGSMRRPSLRTNAAPELTSSDWLTRGRSLMGVWEAGEVALPAALTVGIGYDQG